MKGIVITTDNDMYMANFRSFSDIADKMGWSLTEHVKPWGFGDTPYCLLIDEEGRLKEDPHMNPIGSLLYGFIVHKTPIVGDIVIMKDVNTLDGPDIDGLDDAEIQIISDVITHVWNVTSKEPIDYTKENGLPRSKHDKPGAHE